MPLSFLLHRNIKEKIWQGNQKKSNIIKFSQISEKLLQILQMRNCNPSLIWRLCYRQLPYTCWTILNATIIGVTVILKQPNSDREWSNQEKTYKTSNFKHHHSLIKPDLAYTLSMVHSLSNLYGKHALCQVTGKQSACMCTHPHARMHRVVLSTLKELSLSIYKGILLLGFEKKGTQLFF